MLDLEAARQAHRRDMAEVLNRLTLASDDEWLAPTACAGWTVADLAAHLGAGQAMRADALSRMQAGVGEPGAVPEVRGDRAAVLAVLQEQNGRMEAELARLTEGDVERAVPMPFGAVPLGVMAQIFVMEAGVHAQDVQMAMSGQAVLPLDVIEATTGVLTVVLHRGDPPAEEGVAYRLCSNNIDICFTWRGGEWVHDPGEGTCLIEGDDNTVLLFALGRIPADDPGLRVTDLDAARRFKAYFPGP
jgi:uncharacterized protein (TIGR03083 family)